MKHYPILGVQYYILWMRARGQTDETIEKYNQMNLENKNTSDNPYTYYDIIESRVKRP